MTVPILLPSIVVIFGLAILVILICDRLRLPTIVGFLFTGIIAGPHGLGWVSDIKDVHNLAEIGVVLLLFRIGMKLTIGKILAYKRFFFIAGPLQVIFTVLAGICVAKFLDRPMGESIFLGFLLSLSSTAIVLKLIDDRGESSAPYGKMVLGILIFQDVAAVLMMLATPHLSEDILEKLNYTFLWGIAEGVLLLGVTFFLAGKIIPRLLYYITKTGQRELFLLSTLTICFGVAWLANSLGLSLSLGAFLAGLIIADSEYSTEAIGGLIPYQEVFTSFFFVSVGMLFDLSFVFHNPTETFFVTLGVLLLKSFIATAVTMLTGMPLTACVKTGISISQIGEFSFVLMTFGKAAGIGSAFHYQLFLAVSVFTMMLTPLLIYLAPYIAQELMRLPFPIRLKAGFSPLKAVKLEDTFSDHLIIVGFGYNGHHLAKAAKDADIPYVIIEMNADIVRAEKKKGEAIYFGDATHDAVLDHVFVRKARVLAVMVNDPVAGLRIVSHARHINPSLYIIARTHHVHQMQAFFKVGANTVIPEEFGISVEMMGHVLEKYDVSADLIEKSINGMREEGFVIFSKGAKFE